MISRRSSGRFERHEARYAPGQGLGRGSSAMTDNDARRSVEERPAALVARHPLLRTTYRLIDDTPMQAIRPVELVEVNVFDLRGLPTDHKHAESRRILKEESRFRFDLVNGPVIRPIVIRLDDDEH